jgi:hypothetical protein
LFSSSFAFDRRIYLLGSPDAELRGVLSEMKSETESDYGGSLFSWLREIDAGLSFRAKAILPTDKVILFWLLF